MLFQELVTHVRVPRTQRAGLAISLGIVGIPSGAIWVKSEGHDEEQFPVAALRILISAQTQAADPRIARLFDSLEKSPPEPHAQETPRTNDTPS